MQQTNKRRFFSLYCWIAILLLAPFQTTAQDSPPPFQWAIETGPFISFTGLNYYLAARLQRGAHEVFAGPKIVLSDSYLVTRGPWGLDVGYRWQMLRQEKRAAFISVEYQAAFQQSGKPDRRLTVHEVHLAYGFHWNLGERWKLGNSLGLGAVSENSRNIISGEVNNLTSLSVLFKIFASVDLGKKEK